MLKPMAGLRGQSGYGWTLPKFFFKRLLMKKITTEA